MEDEKNKGGRPVKYTGEYVGEICDKFNEYINNNDIPIVAEFAYKNDVPLSSLYEYKGFGKVLKKCTTKKQANLEKGALTNTLNVPMAIFSLKQLGWSDKIESVNINKNVNHNIDYSALTEDEAKELFKKKQEEMKNDK